jgi:hypothetical protein
VVWQVNLLQLVLFLYQMAYIMRVLVLVWAVQQRRQQE